MEILITGTSGFLGSRAAEYFREQGWQVHAPTHAQLDITDDASVGAWFSQHHPQAVIHCAAVSDTGACQKDPDRTAKINVEGSARLARVCGESGIKLVFCSSDQVYAGSQFPGPHSEAEELTPGTVYSGQKVLAERLCAELCPDTVSLRLSWMYSSKIREQEHGHLLTMLPATFRDETKKISWPLQDFRGLTDTREVVGQLPKVLSLPGGSYNYGAPNDRDTHHTMEKVLTLLGRQDLLARLEPNTQPIAAGLRDIRMDPTKIESFGISFTPTAEGLCRALREHGFGAL